MLGSDSNTRQVPLKRGRFQNLTGQRFERLLVIALSCIQTGKPASWLCLCHCGNTKIINGKHLRQGRTKSCGCLVPEISSKINYKDGRSQKTNPHKYIYDLWSGIKDRCYNQNEFSYPRYGGRGIFLDDAWRNDFEAFKKYILSELGERPSIDHSLDRIVNAKSYVVGNIKWSTRNEQNRNKRSNRMITANNETLCITDWARRLNRTPGTIAARIDRLGWAPENAVTSNSKNK